MKNDKIKKIILTYIYLFIPFIMYSVYKNGYLLYKDNLVNLVGVIKPLILPLIGISLLFIGNKIRKNHDMFDLVNILLISMCVSPTINYLLFILLIISYLVLKQVLKDKINLVVLVILISYMFTGIMNKGEATILYDLTYTDMFIGRNISGISTSSILLSLISLSILSSSIYYKRIIPIISVMGYLGLSIIYYVITKDNSLLFNSLYYFTVVFISTIPEYSPNSKKDMVIYASILFIGSFLISLINPYISVFVTLLILSIIKFLRGVKKKNEVSN